MYEKEFQLKSRPFQAGSRAEFWCQTGNSAQAVEQICQTLTRGSGISVLVGGAGTGKTLTLDIVTRRFADRNPEIVQITCSRLDQRRDVLQRILFELNLPCRDMSESDLRLMVIQHFRGICGQNGRELLLVVDEAHNLAIELIDELRIIVESASRNTGRCHLVLAGTSRLEDHLNNTNLDTFNQRISCRVYLTAMDRKETSAYVKQHMQRAGGGKREFFSPDALRELASVTGGIPRLVNQVCDQCLIACANSGGKIVEQKMVTDAWCDIQNLPRQKAAPVATKPGSSTAATLSSVEFGSLDDDEPVSEPAKQKTISAPMASMEVGFDAELEETAEGQTAFEHDFSVAGPVDVSHETDGSPFGERFLQEEPVQSGKPRKASSRPEVAPSAKKPATSGKTLETHTQIDASTMVEFPAYESVLESDSETGTVAEEVDTELPSNPICEEPSMEVFDTIPIQSVTTSRVDDEYKIRNTDDRDILVSADATIYEPTSRAPEVEETEPADEVQENQSALRGPHKSGAVRMDYRQLFAQLRNEAS